MLKITDPLRVAVVFGPGEGEIRPAWFGIGRHKYQVEEITYAWRDISEQLGPCRHWTVTTNNGEDLYELPINRAVLLP